MALFRTRSAAVYGIDAYLVDVEVDMYPGTSGNFITVGMPDTAVRESRERIKSALLNSGFGYPNKSVTINLAPGKRNRWDSRQKVKLYLKSGKLSGTPWALLKIIMATIL